MKKYFKGPVTSLEREKGLFYFEVENGEITRHATALGGTYSWATLEDNAPLDYLFTEDPSFDGPTDDEEAITKEEFELIWSKAGGP